MATTLNVTHADNEVTAYLNGFVVYDKKTEGDPTFNDNVDLTPYLAAGINTLIIAGTNWGGPANFQGSVTVGSVVTPFNFKVSSSVNGMIFNQTFVIPK